MAPAATSASIAPSGTRMRRSSRRKITPVISLRHRHGAQRHALPYRELFGRALELAAGGEDVASARCAHRRGIAGIEHHLGKLLNVVPFRALVGGAGPRIERNE